MRRRLLLPILVSLAGAALIGLLAYGLTTQSSNRTLDELVARRSYPPAPEAARLLPILDGHGSSSLARLQGRVVVLNFWASWCKPCEQEAPLLEHAQTDLLRHGGTILGVTYEDASTDARAFVSRFHLSYPNLRDSSGEFAHSYGTNELPESFVLDRRGRIVAISRGEIEQRFLDRAISLAASS